MSIGKRIGAWFGSKRNSGRDTADFKERLDDTYRSQAASLQQVRRAVADVVTSRKRVELQLNKFAAQSQQLDQQAQAFVAAGDDEQARAALTRKVAIDKSLAQVKQQRDDLLAQESHLQGTLDALERDVEGFRVRKDTLSARHTAASARASANDATTGINSQFSQVNQELADVERSTRELDATADALEEIARPADDADEWDKQFKQLGDGSGSQ
jgi:phage shock protein A